MTKNDFKKEAVRLRRAGFSYALIRKTVPVSKSTLALWLRNVPYTPNTIVKNRIRGAALKSLKWSQKSKRISIENARFAAKKDLGSLSRRDLFLLGIGLYIGEGSKTNGHVRVINSDPDVICLALRWFKEIFGLKISNFWITIHLYPDNNIEESLVFWSKKTGIPLNQFGKTQVDRRPKQPKKRGMLRYGTAHVRVKSCGDISKGIFLFRRILATIECVLR